MLEVWPKGSNIIRENLGSSSRDGARILFSNILTFLYGQKLKNQKRPVRLFIKSLNNHTLLLNSN